MVVSRNRAKSCHDHREQEPVSPSPVQVLGNLGLRDGYCGCCGLRRGDLVFVRYVLLCPDCAEITFRRFPSQRPTPGEVLAEALYPTPELGSGKFFCADLSELDSIRLRAEWERLRQVLLWEEDRPSAWRLDRFREIISELRRRGVQV